MKQKFTFTIVFLILFFLIRYPAEAIEASRGGMQLWLNVLVPSLLPFLILTDVLLHNEWIHSLFRPLALAAKIFPGLSSCGTSAFLLGTLCGNPMGAKLASDLFTEQKISKKEAEYLLVFSTNASPVFLAQYLAGHCLKNQRKFSEILFILFSANVLCMIVFRFFIFQNQTEISYTSYPIKKETSASSLPERAFDVSIMNAFDIIARLGGYILLFSLISAILSHYCPFSPKFRCIFSGILEITTGLNLLAESSLHADLKYVISMTLTAFGGLSILAQNRSVLNEQLSIIPYISAKILNAAITGFLTVLFL